MNHGPGMREAVLRVDVGGFWCEGVIDSVSSQPWFGEVNLDLAACRLIGSQKRSKLGSVPAFDGENSVQKRPLSFKGQW